MFSFYILSCYIFIILIQLLFFNIIIHLSDFYIIHLTVNNIAK